MKRYENCRDFLQNSRHLVPLLEQATVNNETLFPLVVRARVVGTENRVLRAGFLCVYGKEKIFPLPTGWVPLAASPNTVRNKFAPLCAGSAIMECASHAGALLG